MRTLIYFFLPFSGLDDMHEGNYEKACLLFSQCERLHMTFLETRNNDDVLDNLIDLAECYFMLGKNIMMRVHFVS